MNTKAFWKSKTFWLNVLSIGLAVAGGQLGIPVPPHVAVPVLAVGNLILRTVTTQPIGVADAPAQSNAAPAA